MVGIALLSENTVQSQRVVYVCNVRRLFLNVESIPDCKVDILGPRLIFVNTNLDA